MNQYGLNSNQIISFKSVQEKQMQQNPRQPQMQPVQQPLPLPSAYRNSATKSKSTFKENLKKWDMMGLIYPWVEHPFLMLGTCFGLGWGVDKFSKACSGEYEKSLVGKAANLGDRIQNSKFVQSKPFQSVWNWGKRVTNKTGNFFGKSDLINAVKNTPSQPEWGFVKDELLSMKQRVIHDFSRVTKTLKLTEEGFAELKELGLDKQEKEFLTTFFKGNQVSEEMASNAVQLKRIGLSDSAINDILSKSDATVITKAKQLEKLGVDAEFLQKLEKNPASLRDIIKVREACKNGKGIRIGAGHQKWLGKIQPFERYIGLDEVGNRLTSMTKAKTKLGKIMASFLQKCHRGFTFGGGKIGVLLFVSPLLVETMMNVKKAEPKQKVGTAAQGSINAISWVFTFPLALSIMHHLAGVQYAGMSKEKVAEYRNLITDFNTKVDMGLLKDKADYDKALKELKFGIDGKGGLKALRETKNQSLLTKICKKLGSFVTMDLETIRPYKGSNTIANIGRKIPNFLKNVGGVPMRLIIWGCLTMGVLDAAINKGVKACFGNYYDGMKAEEHEEQKKTQKEFLKQDLHDRLVNANNQKVYGAMIQSNIETQTSETSSKEYNNQVAEEKMRENIKKMASIQEGGSTENKLSDSNSLHPEASIITSDKSITDNQNVANNGQETPAMEQNLASSENPINQMQTTIPNNSMVQRSQNVLSDIPQNAKQEKIAQPVDSYTYIPNPDSTLKKDAKRAKRDNYTYIPSSENVLRKNENAADAQKYIPSQEGAKFTKTFDNSGLEGALKRADRAEQRAIQVLAGNFNSLS